MSDAQKINFIDEPSRPGVDRADWHGGPFTVVRYSYAPGSVFPAHNHDSAQVTVLLSGRIIFEVEGDQFVLDPGETFYIPGGASHSARVPEGGDRAVSINIFHPPRKDHP